MTGSLYFDAVVVPTSRWWMILDDFVEIFVLSHSPCALVLSLTSAIFTSTAITRPFYMS